MRRAVGVMCCALSLACGSPPEDGPACAGGDAYPAEAFADAAAEVSAVDALAELNAIFKDAAARPTAETLKAIYTRGEPSLASLSTEPLRARVSGLLEEAAAVAGNDWAPSEPPAQAGGRYGGILFSARGVEFKESVEKGVMVAAFFNEAQRLMEGEVTPTAVDRMVALFGTTPAFPMAAPDRFAASYAKKRTNPDAATPGLYPQLRRAFIDARSAAGACAEKRAEALAAVRKGWERVLVGTTYFYLNGARKKLEGANASEADRATALHMLNEAVGTLRGLRELPPARRALTDAQLDALLEQLLAPTGGEAQLDRFVTDADGQLPRLTTAMEQLSAAADMQPDEAAGFTINY